MSLRKYSFSTCFVVILSSSQLLAEGVCFMEAKYLNKRNEADWSFLSVEIAKIIEGFGNGGCEELKKKLPTKSKITVGPISKQSTDGLKKGVTLTFETVCTKGLSFDNTNADYACENWKLKSPPKR